VLDMLASVRHLKGNVMSRFGNVDILFYSKGDNLGVVRVQAEAVQQEINSMSENQILNGSIEDLVNYIDERYKINVPILDVENATVTQSEAQVQVSGVMYGLGPGQVHSVPGTQVTLEIPYEGDEILFDVRASTYTMSPPRGIVTKTHLVLQHSGTSLTSEQVQNGFDKTIAEIEGNLSNLRRDFSAFNDSLKENARKQIEARKQKLFSNQNLVSGLKFKLKERPGAPITYAAPITRRKMEAVRPAVPATAQYTPEPVLPEEDYQNILKIIHDMTLVMERSPSSFSTMQEEDIRQHFLVQLNGQYEGKASGETFNANGKTDILVREDGKNIFIAECKFWRGDKSYTDTIEQLLSYLSWRDTKTALIIFNRNKDFTNVLQKIRSLTEAHPLCKSGPKVEEETRFRYVFGQPNDANREVNITVLVFDIPEPEQPV
jgi:hypothetical protein